MPRPTIFVATDHAGFRLKEQLKRWLETSGYEVIDFGTTSSADVDYPDFVIPAAEAVAAARGKAMGIVLGGSGLGEAMAANKVSGIRAAVAYDAQTARLSREHNDANVLSLGGRTQTKSLARAKKIVHLFLTTPFSGAARHIRRIRKITAYESR